MGRSPCCDKKRVKKGAWSPEEDKKLIDYMNNHGQGSSWQSLPKLAGLVRCGKSCRLRWTNYLRPDIKRGPFSPEEEKLVVQLHAVLGNRWAAIASHLHGRTDNEIKNLYNTHLKKKRLQSPSARHVAKWEGSDHILRLWNSEVGEAFRRGKETSASSRAGPASCSSSKSAEWGSFSGVSNERTIGDGDRGCNKIVESDSNWSANGVGGSSESNLQLLLDRGDDNDMSFLGEEGLGLFPGIYS